MSDVVVSEFMDEAAVSWLRERFDVLYEPALADRSDELLNRIAGARALIVRNRTQVRGNLLDAGKRLRVIGRLGVGLDNIDVEACRARGIRVIPAIGANNIAVAEYVIAAMLILVRGAYAANPAMLAGEWPRNRLMGGEVYGRTLGLVGFGGIAREVAARARPLGLQVQAFDPALGGEDALWQEHGVAPVASLDELLRSSDIVSLHVPLTDETHHLIDADALERMRPGAILINAARGGVVDDAALAAALHTGHLEGAALHVFEVEPLPADSVYRDVSNVLLTPHIAGVTQESNSRVSRMIAEAVAHSLEETP
jgi:(S)-sulfolactate dehydrogenase